MKITISYEEYKKCIIEEAHRLMVQEAIAEGGKERQRIRAKIQACELQLDKLEGMRIRREEQETEQGTASGA